MKKLLIFIFISFVAQKAAVASEPILGEDAAEIIEKGKILELNITDDDISYFNDYRVHVIYKGIVHICYLHTGVDAVEGKVSRTKCIQFIDKEGVITNY